MNLHEKLFRVLIYFAPTQNGAVYGISEKEIAVLIRSDNSGLNIHEVPRLIDKLERDGYVVFDKERRSREKTGLPYYKYYSITIEGEEVLKNGKYPAQTFWDKLYEKKWWIFWGTVIAIILAALALL